MSKYSGLVLLVVVLSVNSASAQVTLEWHFKEGDTFFAERIYTQKQSVEIKSNLFKEQRTKTWLTAVTVKEKTAAGHVLDLKALSVSFQSTGERRGLAVPGGFDDKIAAKIKGTSFTVTVSPQGKLVKFDGYDTFIMKLADKNAELEKVLKVLLSEEAVREDVEEIFNFLPEKPVHKGDKWKREATEPVPPFGSFKSAFEYVLEEDKGTELGIGYTIKMTYKPPSGDGDLFRVSKGGLNAEEGKGSIVFDAKRGWLVSGEKTVHVRGELVIEAMGNQTPLEFASENTLRVRVFAKDEAKKE